MVGLDGGRVAVRELALRSETQRIDGSGSFDLGSGAGTFDVRVATADLDETARLQPFVALEPPPLWLPRSGTGEIRAAVRLARGAAEAKLDFELADLHAPGLVADTARGGLVVGEAAARDVDVVLTRADSRLRVSGVLPFEGTGRAAPLAALTVAFESWPVEEAGPWFPLPLPITGPADGTLDLTGRPPDYGGELVAAVSPAAVAGLGFERLDVELAWNESELVLRRMALLSFAGEVAGEGTYRFADDALDLRFASGEGGLELAAQPFSGLWGDRVTGKLALTGAIRGTMERPEGEVDGTIAGFALRGRDLSPEGEPRIHARLGDGRLEADVSLPGLLEIRGGGPFVPGESVAIALDIASERLDRWVEVAAGTAVPDFTGAIGAKLTLVQSAGGPLTGELVADRLDLAHRGRSVGLIEPARVSLDGSVLRIATLYLGDAGGRDELFVAGSVPIAEESRLDLKVQAAASVDWFEEWLGLDLDGRIELLSTVGGSLARPEWNGEAALRDARLIPPRLPHTLDRMSALVLFYPEAVVLDEARGEIGGGQVTAFGRLDLPHEGRPLDYRFQTSIRDTTIRYPAGFLLRGGGDLTLQSTAEGRQVRGEIALARVDYLQDIDLSPTQIIQRFLTRTRLQVEETDDFLSSTYLSVAVEGPGALRVRNNIARLDGSLDLTVRGTLANPVLFGEVVTVPGGTFEYGGNTYEIERGVLTFVNPSRIVPVVDLVTMTRIDDYEVQLTVGGSLDRLATNFSSNPPLSEYDVLALLATGSTTGDDTFSGSGSDAASGAQAAESLLYGQAAALIGSRVGTLFGVDRLRIDPLTTGDSVSAARVTVGKRLSRKVYVTYSVDPSSTAQQILEVEWRVSDELMLVLTQNGDGSYALDTRWRRRF
jgi:translocation and assembly module TamB